MIACTLLLSGLVSLAAAEPPQSTRPDFSGTWQVDGAASKALTEKEGHEWQVVGARSGGGNAAAADPNDQSRRPIIVITQSDTEIVFERRFDDIVLDRGVYKLDGTLSVNADRDSSSRSKTVWKGSSLVTTGTREMDMSRFRTQDGRPLPSISEEFVTTRTLLPDGTMRVESRRTRNGRESIHISVMRRVRQP